MVRISDAGEPPSGGLGVRLLRGGDTTDREVELEVVIGPVVGTHTGPGTVGLALAPAGPT